ncbi:tetratricopeptide repeat protein [Alkalihalophilus pseudofirmus]|uniref:tetratricopeptide repeat protein n=1 Tax=Alkalihalophilus pseudofirmus TaxID=79885 RepID=UPI00259B292F|nr:tetratricopeptide repeat protein [Alkalihalophilus pseudofirmus]WEG19077.1 tetratricopeptide repeat protein [Alkalihalophilus pseudofirmus]
MEDVNFIERQVVLLQPVEREIKKAISYRQNHEYNESNKLLLELVRQHPDHAITNYQCAWSYDILGEESLAVPYYKKAISLGLPEKELQGAYLGLGSTYRTLGLYGLSKETFCNGISNFPHNKALQTFYAMTLYNLNEHNKAMDLLLNCLVKTTSDPEIKLYQKAIEFYSDKLDQVWK